MNAQIKSPAEQTLTAIWNDVLQRTGDIDAAKGFFELGGDSVAMMMLLFKVEQVLGVEIFPEQVFQSDRFADMVSLIESREREASSDERAFVSKV